MTISPHCSTGIQMYSVGVGNSKRFQSQIVHRQPHSSNFLQSLTCAVSYSFSDWAAPIVPVMKSDKSIRICGDFKQTINKVSKLEHYPIPKINDLFATLSGGTSFSKLDLSQAYQQLVLNDEFKQYTVINTHQGLFRYNRLPFGIASAPGIFQRTMEGLLGGLPHVFVYLDDILVLGTWS